MFQFNKIMQHLKKKKNNSKSNFEKKKWGSTPPSLLYPFPMFKGWKLSIKRAEGKFGQASFI